MKILHVVGARPNYMKVAPVLDEMARWPGRFEQVLVHTGQHYDNNMSRVFFEDLALREPDEYLGIGSGSHAQQTAQAMLAFEPVVVKHAPDWVMVVGDVNSTLACALVCSKLGIPVAHVEAGLRSDDWTMPEEVNRVLTDRMATLLFTPSRDADDNLRREGIPRERIRLVGNVMIDSLVRMLPQAQASAVARDHGLLAGGYVLVTLHRPSNVDDAAVLREIIDALDQVGGRHPVVFPVHPRTRDRIARWGLARADSPIHYVDPLGYREFLALMRAAGVVVTDSGGVQEETTYLGVPCLTIRPNTERPITIQVGTNKLISPTRERVVAAVEQALAKGAPGRQIPELWDGRAARRIVEALCAL